MTAHVVQVIWGGLLALLLGTCAGCAFGPKAIERTHGRYASAVQRVDEEQLLKNIVRLRYVEAPQNLDVAAIAAQYELSTSAEARPFFSTESSGNLFRAFEMILPFVSVTGANRPTVSLTPQDDGTTVRQFLTPITAETLVFLGQSGWPVSSIFRIWVDRMNGVPNLVPPSGPLRDIPPDFERFRRASELFQVAQDRELLSVHAEDRTTDLSGPLPANAVTAAAVVEAARSGFEYQPQAGGKTWILVKHEKRLVLQVNPSGLGSPELGELVGLLNLVPGRERYELVVASGVPDPAKNHTPPVPILQLTLRSTAQALFFLANGVEIPPEHVAAGLVREPNGVNPNEATEGLFQVHVCKGHRHKPPAGAYLAIWYRDHWYYVDDRDQETKATLLLMLQLKQLDFKRQSVGTIPTLTLPVGR